MQKTYIRIDDRLIHGQIVTAWCSHLSVNRIIGIDDKTAKNPILKQIMTMAAPAKIKCEVLTKEEAKQVLSEDYDGNTLIVLRFPEDLADFYEELEKVDQIIVGNVSKKENSIIEMNAGISVFYLTQRDCDVLKEYVANGNEVIFKTVPNSNEISWQSFVKNYLK